MIPNEERKEPRSGYGHGEKGKRGKAPLVSVRSSDFPAHGLLSNWPLQRGPGKDFSLKAPSKSGQQSKAAGGSADLLLFIRGEAALRDRVGKWLEKEAGLMLHRTCGENSQTFYIQDVKWGLFPGTVAIKQRNLVLPIELGQHVLQLPQCEELDLILVILGNDRPSFPVFGVHLAAGTCPDVAGFINPPLGDIVVPRHGTYNDVGGVTALGIPDHRLLLVVVPGATVEFLILGHYVGEGEGNRLAAGIIVVATGVQMATVQTCQVLVVLEDSLALAELL